MGSHSPCFSTVFWPIHAVTDLLALNSMTLQSEHLASYTIEEVDEAGTALAKLIMVSECMRVNSWCTGYPSYRLPTRFCRGKAYDWGCEVGIWW
jgi:hypothetical protein